MGSTSHLNQSYYTSQTNDDFRFVYMGEEGTFTSLHTDVCKLPSVIQTTFTVDLTCSSFSFIQGWVGRVRRIEGLKYNFLIFCFFDFIFAFVWVDGSYSWSANICGQKRWNLYEPGSSTPISFVQSEGEVVFV